MRWSLEESLSWDDKKAQLMQGLRPTAVRVYEPPYSRNLSSAGNPTLEPNIMSIGKPVAKLCQFLYVSRHLEFYITANSAIRSADPENPGLEPNMEWIGCIV